MTSKERKVVLIIVGVILAILLISIIVKNVGKSGENANQNTQNVANDEKYVTELGDGTKVNNSKDLNSTKTYKTIEISEIQYTTNTNGNSVLLATLKNTGTTAFEREVVTINILGESGETIDTITAVIPQINVGETKTLNASATADLANAKDFTITAK